MPSENPASLENARLSTDSGIPYKRLSGPKFHVDESGATATEVYLILASDVEAFIAESVPTPTVVNNLVLINPRRRLPGSSVFVTHSLDLEPHIPDKPGDPLGSDPNAESGTYETDYLVTIHYAVGLEEDENERNPSDPESFLEHSINVGGEFLNISPKNLCVKDIDVAGGGPGTETEVKDPLLPISKIICLVEHNLRWKYALRPDWATIVKTLGKVNSGVFQFGGFASPAETVLFVGVSGSRKYNWTGVRTLPIRVDPWDISFKFLEKRVEEEDRIYSWQHVWVPAEGKWLKVIRDCGVGNKSMYETASFGNLFRSA